MDKTIGLACNISTGKLDANQAVSGGEYPFFTCAEFPDQIDHFAYDDDVVLVAGNNARGNFHVSRYKGKFNAYQRTYILTAKEGFNIDYVYYALKLELKRLREKSQGSQTKFLTMPILTGIHFRDITGDEQIEIANVLSAIDKKIELNNRINAELEAMAKTLYDYWFVQFDFPDDSPQGQGNPYKTSGGKMVYNPTLKREIPEGWGVKPLSKLVKLVKGNVSPNEIDPSTPYIGLEHIQRKKLALEDWVSSEAAESDKTVFEKGDILFGKIRPYFHKVTVAPFDGITSTDTLIFRPSSKNYFGLALEVIFSDEFVSLSSQSSTGSKMPRADWSVLKQYPVAIPCEELLNRFQAQIEQVINHLNLTTLENRELRNLRDWLLPMLMNGQVTVE